MPSCLWSWTSLPPSFTALHAGLPDRQEDRPGASTQALKVVASLAVPNPCLVIPSKEGLSRKPNLLWSRQAKQALCVLCVLATTHGTQLDTTHAHAQSKSYHRPNKARLSSRLLARPPSSPPLLQAAPSPSFPAMRAPLILHLPRNTLGESESVHDEQKRGSDMVATHAEQSCCQVLHIKRGTVRRRLRQIGRRQKAKQTERS